MGWQPFGYTATARPGLPNCNTARPPADTPRTPACPLAAAVAALLGQRGKMTDFRALAEKMRPLLNEAKLKSRPESMTSRFDPHAIVTTHEFASNLDRDAATIDAKRCPMRVRYIKFYFTVGGGGWGCFS